jgi:hypothetical protein
VLAAAIIGGAAAILNSDTFTVDPPIADLLTTTLMSPSVGQTTAEEAPRFFFADRVDVPYFGTEEASALMSDGSFGYDV